MFPFWLCTSRAQKETGEVIKNLIDEKGHLLKETP